MYNKAGKTKVARVETLVQFGCCLPVLRYYITTRHFSDVPSYYGHWVSATDFSRTMPSRVGRIEFDTVGKTLRFSAMACQRSFHSKLFNQHHCQRICGTVFYRCNLVLVTLFFVMSTVHPTAAQLSKTNGIVLPSGRQQVINSGSNFSITCIFVHNDTIVWSLPDYFEFQKRKVS